MKPSFIHIYEPDEKKVHVDAPPGFDQVTLCGRTDWLGVTTGRKTTKPVDCLMCRKIVEFCQSHRKIRKERKPAILTLLGDSAHG